jgi:carbon-monoxide dehydrogenase medium subunit
MPAPPELVTPTSPAEAAAAFGDGSDVTVMAGGTILLPELTHGRLRPARVLMLGRAGLSGVGNSNGVVRIGAGTPVADLQDAPEPHATAAGHIADGEIRAVATIGGNLCATAGQAAPRGDLQAPLLALGARVTSVGPGGEKTQDVEEFLEDPSGRLVLSIDVPGGQPSGYARLDRPHTHHYTMLAVSAVRGGDDVRLAASGVGPRARRLAGAESALAAGASAAEAAAHAAEGLELPTDALASAWYREQVLPLLVERALGQLGGR